MFSQSIVNAIKGAATKAGIEPAALLALVEVETSGNPFEQDGRTPALLYERHIAWRMAAKVSKALQTAFARAGLAIPKWSKATQYKDQGTSANRLALIAKARTIDAEVANQSASWGLGQTMGFLYAELGFGSACAMVEHLTGNVAGQIECMIHELNNKRLVGPLNAHDWAKVARIYNGAGYAANRYDVRLADSYKRWLRKLAAPAPDVAPDLSRDEIVALQRKLRGLGYAIVGRPDGEAGRNTSAALTAFQRHEGLPITGTYDAATREAMRIAEPVDQAPERARATADDLAAAGSKTIKVARVGGMVAKIKGIIGGGFLAGGLASHEGLLDTAQSGIDKATQAKGIWDSFCDLAGPLFGHPMAVVAGVVLIASAVAVGFVVKAIVDRYVIDYRAGVHAGAEG